MYIRDIFSHLLASCGYDIQVAKSNNEALEFLKLFSFDLILVDINMTGMTLTEFLSVVKQKYEYKHIPIMAVTGVPNLINQSDLNQIQAVLEKPFEPDDLINKVKALLN